MDAFFDSIEEVITKHWFTIVVLILAYFAWKFNLTKEVLSWAGLIVLGRIAWIWWIHYIQQDFISGIDFVLLEIIPPRDVLRSPKAMELFITNALYHWSFKGGKEEYWQGAVWFWFSLEIVSLEGQVHFYIRTPTRVRGLIETQIYAQYPQSQVKAVEDYTLAVDEISPKSAWNGWGCEFKLLKPEAYPIKTYIDYALDKDPKEEYKVDPISPVIELFGSLQKGEQAWVQIIITPSKKEYHTKGTWFDKHDWVQEAKNELMKLLLPYTSQREDPGPGLVKLARIEVRTPSILDRATKAMSAKTSKIGFDTGIRLMYVAKKESFDMNSRRNIRLIFRQYAAPDVNGLVRCNSAQGDFYSGVLTASPKLIMVLANRMLHEYRERAFFHLPLRHHIFSQNHWDWPFPGFFTVAGLIKAYAHHHTYVLNTEELATIWHFPGQILKVPTLERIESKEASPPTNLPI
ncbi:hypothetical protein A3C60_01370 [Candidatus Nomurabacteria bacterium RIFCSPHIGHO2_02_FULL_37_45]|uniref:DUF8128 domain-containing protein n=1 Tax=Candidatus Nomurabacteria bacterium RIFCSPLOWO2_12_FULL_37_8 TaxID=1801793 RepID=A0A1F6Y3R7_9BACT|nr:MAG: hypothetical protein A2727_02035 [Candidatus Nomurabacteria bacterium RIFCSPHIGHO2_01_FULL_37_110]OGI71285.1 MAG: hypothetical protein A3C60_01370 [Candidatus Nomurabacteria bacterium RIFCSPHIGHO2_02_FULL_37_45]OGJ00986.1 MAG: hypothetical protein A3G98_00590 [Candidatus Nomurabacteria bacterium RIFCSPLOWO2_12_FULL_37_8]